MTTRDSSSTDESARGVGRRDLLKGAGAVAVSAAVASTATIATRTAHAQVPGEVRHVTTSDGVSLYYSKPGPGSRS
jgi:hypothetical protein